MYDNEEVDRLIQRLQEYASKLEAAEPPARELRDEIRGVFTGELLPHVREMKRALVEREDDDTTKSRLMNQLAQIYRLVKQFTRIVQQIDSRESPCTSPEVDPSPCTPVTGGADSCRAGGF